MSIHDSVSRSATAQRLETPESIEQRFDAWDCEEGSVRSWALGRRQCVLSLVRLLADDTEEMSFATPMEVTIAPTAVYQRSPSWRERFGGTYQVAVYPNANPDWGSVEAEVGTLADALAAAERLCSDLEEQHDLQRAGEEKEEREGREGGEITLSWRGPKPIV
ncbi:hypothetical protein [Saliphagus sp. LR7]|uniref:hypothetical protein n=1 Tax=Saliphagus sp. LR7 TaxID=2282654 RepID=UPI000DF7A48E|nr:hypothetical protein [Saliphagus sp. LR7]